MATQIETNEINPVMDAPSIDKFPDDKEYYPLPSSIYEAKQMNDEYIQGNLKHEGVITMFRNSLKAYRSCNEAIIFIYGLSGAGKTSTLNHVFGVDEIIIKEHRKADTTLVSEYIATMSSEDWKVTNLEIGFIDVPGWNDTRGWKQDAINMANIDYFIRNHPYLGCKHIKCYPSIILIAIDATHKRMEGNEASFTVMIRSLLKLRIVDKTRPNVLFVITNVHSIPKGKYKEELEDIETYLRNLSKEILGLSVAPTIVHIENKWKDHDLDKKGIDWTVLRDGTPQPINVLEAMINMTKRYKDEVGQEAIRIFSKSRGTNNPKCRRKSNPEALPVDLVRKWQNELLPQFETFSSNEVNNALFDYAQSQLDRFKTPNILNSLINALEKKNITQLQQLQSKTLTQIKDLLCPYRIDEIEKKALLNVCGVIPFDIPHIVDTIGCGIVNTEQGVVTQRNLFRLVDDESIVMANLKIPKCMEAVIPIETTRVKLIERREKRDTGSVKYQFQICHCVCSIKLILSNQQQLISQLSPAFKEAVAALPDSSVVEESQQVRQEHQHFFTEYGHFVVVASECGGVVQGEVELMDKDTNHQQQQFIKSFLYNLIDRLESNKEVQTTDFGEDERYCDIRDIQNSILKSQLSWIGGKPMKEEWSFSNLSYRDWIQWVDSLSEYPILLEPKWFSNNKAVPLFKFVELVNREKSILVRLAHETLVKPLFNFLNEETDELDCGDISNDIRGDTNLNVLLEGYDIVDITREIFSGVNVSETVGKLKNGRGFLGTSKVIKLEEDEKISKIEIQHLKAGDKILHREQLCNQNFVQIKNITKTQGQLQYKKIVHEFGESKIGICCKIVVSNKRNLESIAKIIPGDIIFCLDGNKIKKSKVVETEEASSSNKFLIQVNGKSLLLVDGIFVGDEEAACFPGNGIITLRGGDKVRMDEVKIGDHVLSIHPKTGKPVYSKVYLWAHRDPHITATFLHITHPHGHLHISANHLILSGEQRRPVPADHLTVGDTIHSFLSPTAATATTATAISVPVLHIHTCTQVGFYAPFTNNGLIVVDGIASSVYSQLSPPRSRSHAHVCAGVTGGLVGQLGMHRVGECVMAPVRVACKLSVGSLVLTKQMDATTHIHKYCQCLMKMYDYFV